MGILDPSGAVIARKTFLTNNSAIARFPTSQIEWSSFLFEFNNNFIQEEGSFIATFTGFSTDPDGPTGDPVINYVQYGPIVHLRLGLSVLGTSDAVTFEITNLPARLQPDTAQIYWFFGGHDAGAVTAEPISVLFQNSATIKFGLGHDNPAGGGWTSSATTKGFTNANLTLSYSLWSKGMSIASSA